MQTSQPCIAAGLLWISKSEILKIHFDKLQVKTFSVTLSIPKQTSFLLVATKP